jgi:peroxiredoxin Q/BCP
MSGEPNKTRNIPMIEPSKTTKGRRMSKETRKKSSERSVPRAAAPSRSKANSKIATKSPRKPARSAAKAASALARSTEAQTPPADSARDSASTRAAVILSEGDAAPDFTLPRDGGGTISLADFAGRKLALFFYPKANTPGCTREAVDFSGLAREFAACGTTVLGVSADSVKAQDGFRDKHALTVPLLSDAEHQMLQAYGAWGEKSLYGRRFLGIIRSTVLIGADGRIAKIWRNVKVDGHADTVLAAAQSL